MKKYALPALRVLIGLIFLVSGLEKSFLPYQNFLYVIQGYQFLPSSLELVVAKSLPWIELVTGLFLILGLWTRWAVISAAAMFVGFIVIIGQALIRGIDLSECGCFGDLIHIPPQIVIMMDSISLLICLLLLKNLLLAEKFSLDSRSRSL